MSATSSPKEEGKIMLKGKAIGQTEYFADNLPTEFTDEWGGVWLRSGNIETDPAKFDDEYWQLPANPDILGDYIHYEKGTTTTENLRFSVAHDGSLFVCCGSTHTILTSPDGVVWTEQVSGISDPNMVFHCNAYGNGLFVVVGGLSDNTSSTILTSPDGINWTERTSLVINALMGVEYGNGLFVATGNNGNILTSPDGITWTQQTSPVTKPLYNPTYGNGWWVASMPFPDGTEYGIIKSQDGISWVKQDIGTKKGTLSCGYGLVDGTTPTYIVGCFDSLTLHRNELYLSHDTVNWVTYNTPTSSNLYDCIFTNGLFIIAPMTAPIITSKDGINWSENELPTDGLVNNGIGFGVVGDKTRVIAVGNTGAIVTYELEDDLTPVKYAGIPKEERSLDGIMVTYCRIR
jgi:hypothetical protein